MARKSKVERELEKKDKRRIEEIKILKDYQVNLHTPVPPKKPMEFNFEKDDLQSFEYPIAIGNTLLEKKSDGKCIHVSIDHSRIEPVKLYSSQSNEWNPLCFPEVLKDLLKQPSGYYHGELLGLKPDNIETFTSLDEFKAVTNRPKDNAQNLTPEKLVMYPLKIDFFDVLMMNGESMLVKPLVERRSNLEAHIEQTKHVNLIPQWIIKDKESLQQHYIDVFELGYEGLIAKDPWSFYHPGKRNSDWIKLKEFLTLDLAVLGFYETPESRKAGKLFSSVLIGSYNDLTKNFETMAKIKIGKKQDQEEIWSKVKDKIVSTDQIYERTIRAYNKINFNPTMQKIKKKIPDHIAKYDSPDNIAIIEVQTQDITYSNNWHTCGRSYDNKNAHSLRIPTFKCLRDDKSRLQDITSTQQIHEYYQG